MIRKSNFWASGLKLEWTKEPGFQTGVPLTHPYFSFNKSRRIPAAGFEVPEGNGPSLMLPCHPTTPRHLMGRRAGTGAIL